MPTIVLLALLMYGCSIDQEQILNFSDVNSFEIQENKSGHDILLKISGLAFHSALSVKKIEIIADGSTALVYAYLVLTKDGGSGSFAYEYIVPKNIDQVYFGPDKHLIWTRAHGPYD